MRDLTELFEPVVESMGYELVGVEFNAAGNHGTLRVYIDREAGVNIDDCAEKFARAQDAGLDALADGLLQITGDLVKQGLFISQELIAATRLQVDAVKWYLAKRGPKRYGDARLLGQDDGGPVYLIGLLVDARERLANASKPTVNITPSD